MYNAPGWGNMSPRDPFFFRIINSVRNKQLPTCPPRVEIAGGKLIDL